MKVKVSPSCAHIGDDWFKNPPAPKFSIGQRVSFTWTVTEESVKELFGETITDHGYIVGQYFADEDLDEYCLLLGWRYAVYFNDLACDIDYPDDTPINSPIRLMDVDEDKLEAIASEPSPK